MIILYGMLLALAAAANIQTAILTAEFWVFLGTVAIANLLIVDVVLITYLLYKHFHQ